MEWSWVFCLICSGFFSRLHHSYFLSTANSLQSLFLSIFSYAVYYWQCSMLCPSSLALKLGWASAVPPVPAEVLGGVTDSIHTSSEIPYTHTRICVQCSVLVGVHIHPLYNYASYTSTKTCAWVCDYPHLLWVLGLILGCQETSILDTVNINFICRKFCFAADIETSHVVLITKLLLALCVNWSPAIRGQKHEVQSLEFSLVGWFGEEKRYYVVWVHVVFCNVLE